MLAFYCSLDQGMVWLFKTNAGGEVGLASPQLIIFNLSDLIITYTVRQQYSCQNQLTRMKHKINYQHPLIKSNLKNKYGNKSRTQSSGLLSLYKIDQMVYPKHHLNSYRINSEELQIQCNQKQFLKRYYEIHEYTHKSIALTQYYKYHRNYPFHLGVEVGLIIMIYQQARNKQQRKFIKMLMNQPASVSETSFLSQTVSPKKHTEGHNSKQFSLKLKQLDIEDSTLTLKNICNEIDVNFPSIKPLYLYRGTYNDGVKQFKKFILSSKNYKKETQTKFKGFSKQKSHDKEQLKNHTLYNCENEKQNNQRNNQHLHRSRFDSNKQFKKTFNMIPVQNFRKIHKKKNFSRSLKNKTVNVKPQSFSKTTANDTVSREEEPKVQKNRCTNSIRIRKCKTVQKKFMMFENTKSNMNIVRSPQIQSKAKNRSPHREKSSNKLTKLSTTIRGNDNFARSRSHEKRVLKIDRKKIQQKSLSRQESKPLITKQNLLKEPNKLQNLQKSHALENLIKTKLRLRA